MNFRKLRVINKKYLERIPKKYIFKPLYICTSKCVFGSEDTNEKSHDVAFNHVLQYLPTQKRVSEKEKNMLFGNYNLRPFDVMLLRTSGKIGQWPCSFHILIMGMKK